MFHLLNIHKPKGPTSRDVVNRVQQLVPRKTKVGHAGTLDPLAEGVLVLCLGPATRLIEYIQAQPKHYVGTFLLGRRSDTEDTAGTVEELVHPPQPTRDQVLATLPKFVGAIQQRPPAYSALKVQGQRAYALARRGVAVEMASREIEVHELELLRYDYPALELNIHCGSGTYVRSLGRDLAEALGTAAVMSALVRTAIGPFQIAQATPLHQLSLANLEACLLPAALAVAALPSLELEPGEITSLRRGQFIPNRQALNGPEVAAMHAGELVAILTPRGENMLGASKFFGEPGQ